MASVIKDILYFDFETKYLVTRSGGLGQHPANGAVDRDFLRFGYWTVL